MSLILNELKNACTILNMQYSIIEGVEAITFIQNLSKRFNPIKMAGHVAIQSENSDQYSTDEFEFQYSKYLKDEPILLFFDQNSSEKNVVFKLNNGRSLCDVLQECFGIEYFITNQTQTYIISVNWYTIEVLGDAQINLLNLKDTSN